MSRPDTTSKRGSSTEAPSTSPVSRPVSTAASGAASRFAVKASFFACVSKAPTHGCAARRSACARDGVARRVFLDTGVGLAMAGEPVPPTGTRRNYLLIVGGGIEVPCRRCTSPSAHAGCTCRTAVGRVGCAIPTSSRWGRVVGWRRHPLGQAGRPKDVTANARTIQVSRADHDRHSAFVCRFS